MDHSCMTFQGQRTKTFPLREDEHRFLCIALSRSVCVHDRGTGGPGGWNFGDLKGPSNPNRSMTLQPRKMPLL